jgi:hypothetical protein
MIGDWKKEARREEDGGQWGTAGERGATIPLAVGLAAGPP